MLVEAKLTTRPVAGATSLRVTVPVEVFPPSTLVGDRVRELTTAAAIVIVCFKLVVPYVAVSNEVEPAGAVVLVETVNVAVVDPAGITTEAGTVATVVEAEVRFTVAPPVGAALERVSVPVEACPAFTVVGEIVNVVRVGTIVLGICNLQSPRP